MTDPMMNFRTQGFAQGPEEDPDADILRAMTGFAAERLIEGDWPYLWIRRHPCEGSCARPGIWPDRLRRRDCPVGVNNDGCRAELAALMDEAEHDVSRLYERSGSSIARNCM